MQQRGSMTELDLKTLFSGCLGSGRVLADSGESSVNPCESASLVLRESEEGEPGLVFCDLVCQ